MSDLAMEIALFAHSLPGDQVELAAVALERCERFDRGVSERLSALVPTAWFKQRVSRLLAAWAAAGDVPGSSLALALRAARRADVAARTSQQVEIVWSGPEGKLPVRFTYPVLLEVVRAARERLTLVSFTAYGVPEMVAALQNAASNGAQVRLVLDAGTDARRAFQSLGAGVALYTWEPSRLDQRDPRHASLHAKCAVADDRLAFVTSANLTGHAFDRNIELGLLIRGGSVPATLAAHFDALIDAKVLVPLE